MTFPSVGRGTALPARFQTWFRAHVLARERVHALASSRLLPP